MIPTTPASVLVFDSGVGGLSIAAEIRQKIPKLKITYASDNAFFPYGTKTENELIGRVGKVLQALCIEIKPDIIVIACNTASTLTLPYCRKVFSQPIVGVVPAIKPAAQASQSGVIGLLATPATISRSYTQDLIQNFASELHVIKLGSSELVSLAEKKLRGHRITLSQLDPILSGFMQDQYVKQMDNLVLACTHFPLLRQEIQDWFALQEIFPQLIDSGAAIARRVEFLLSNEIMASETSISDASPEASVAFFTSESQDITQLRPTLSQLGFHQVKFISV